MCGIAGLVDLAGRPIDAALLGRMTDVLAHRGPDGSGLLLAQPAGEGFESTLLRTLAGSDDAARTAVVGLGSRRLAIIDTSERGLQPMVDRTGSVALVFNGELYNFRELRDELQARGCTFESGTDTEVFLAAYLAWGDGCLNRAKGMYGFALWDGRAGRLLIGRDRFGIKPLYYARVGDRVAFASEIKALLEAPWLPRIAHDDAVAEFLLHGNCDFAERTVFRDVHALPPGHKLVVDLRRRDLAVSPYYALRVATDSNSVQPDAERLEQLRDLLEGSVRDHLVSDVPVGSCLSGGVDSSAVVGLMGKLLREQPEAATSLGGRIHTFTSSYVDDPSVDERQYALPVAGSVGAQSHLVFPTAQDFVEQFPKMTYHFDMPFGTLSFYAQWCVMRAAKEAGMTVMLDGQGGDEVFGGYGKFRYGYLASLLRAGRVPTLAREAAAMVRQGDRYLLDVRNGYRYLPAGVRRRLGVDSLLARSLRPGLGAASTATSNPATRWWANARGTHGTGDSEGLTVVQRLQMDDITLDTLPQLLRYEDRSSMAFSIEARVPFLDHEVVEFGLGLPDRLKISGGWSKYALRQSLRGVLPDLVRTRKTKLGFAAPDRRWLSSDLRPFAMELLSGELRTDRYVDATALRRDYAATAGRKTPTEAYLGLFRVLSLEMWMRTFEVSCA